MLIPAIAVHFGSVYTEEHERLLYNTLKFQLQEAIRTYLQRTQQPTPIHLIFDMSNELFMSGIAP
jgi:hypothetical protein